MSDQQVYVPKDFEKYQNPDPRCRYPFDAHPLGYCWGWACHVDALDGKPDMEKFKDWDCSNCEFWKEKVGLMPSSPEMIVDAILADLRDRSGGDHWFETCDPEVQQEITRTWQRICQIILYEPLPTEGHPSLSMRIACEARLQVTRRRDEG